MKPLKSKQKKEAEDNICIFCKRLIYFKVDNYVRLTDYKEGKFFMEGFYHTTCYNNQIKGMNPEQTKMKKVALGMLQRAQKLMNKVEGKPEEIYEVT